MKRGSKVLVGLMVMGLMLHVLPMEATSGGISYDVADSAEIGQITYSLEMWKGAKRLMFEIEVKNVSQEPHQYRLKIFLVDGPSAGALYPRKGNPPVIKPGETYKLKLPLLYEKLPAGFDIRITQLDK